MSIKKNIIKILKGTIIKYNGCALKLKESIRVNVSDKEFKLEPHESVLDEDLERNKCYIDDNTE